MGSRQAPPFLPTSDAAHSACMPQMAQQRRRHAMMMAGAGQDIVMTFARRPFRGYAILALTAQRITLSVRARP